MLMFTRSMLHSMKATKQRDTMVQRRRQAPGWVSTAWMGLTVPVAAEGVPGSSSDPSRSRDCWGGRVSGRGGGHAVTENWVGREGASPCGQWSPSGGGALAELSNPPSQHPDAYPEGGEGLGQGQGVDTIVLALAGGRGLHGVGGGGGVAWGIPGRDPIMGGGNPDTPKREHPSPSGSFAFCATRLARIPGLGGRMGPHHAGTRVHVPGACMATSPRWVPSPRDSWPAHPSARRSETGHVLPSIQA